MENCITLVRIVIAPTAVSPPYFSREELKQIFRILSVDCITKGLNPSSTQGRITLPCKRKFFSLNFSVVCFPSRKVSTHVAESACESTVANAAPFTPMPSTKIKIGSRMIFVTAPMRVVFMLILAKPCAVMKAFRPSVSCTKSYLQA